MLDWFYNAESDFRYIGRRLQNAAAENSVILIYFYPFLPEGSGKLGCHASIIQIALSLTHDIT